MADNKREVTISAPALPHFAVLREGEHLVIGLGSSQNGQSFLALTCQDGVIKAVQVEVNSYNGGMRLQAQDTFPFQSVKS